MSARFVAALFAVSLRATATAKCTSGTDTCDAQLSKDQALLQLKRVSISKVSDRNASSACGPVQRRRRQGSMATCRRRFKTPGLWASDKPEDEWKCNEDTDQMYCASGSNDTNDTDVIGYPATTEVKAASLWCAVNKPPQEWNLKSCPDIGNLSVKVLTYNLFWWNLFDRHHGDHASAGRLIARTSGPEQYDFMGFQECDDRLRVLNDAGLASRYEAIDGGRAIALAYLKERWTLLANASVDVGEDSHDQYYGKRSVMWARLQNAENKTVFFMNHHGPLMVSQGGGCTGSATALNIMKVIGEHAHAKDLVILVGDFNANPSSSRIRELSKRLHRVHSGHSMGGVDHVFSNCRANVNGQIIGKGDGYYKSDHDALSATFTLEAASSVSA